MALPPLAQVADLRTAGASGTDAQLELALRRASARVRRYTRQIFTIVEHDTVLLRGGEKVLRLPQMEVIVDEDHPLTVVEVAEFGGVDFTVTEGLDFSRVGQELTRGYPYGSGESRLMGWPRGRLRGVWANLVRATYSHGYAETPEDVFDVVLDLCEMSLSNPENLRQVGIDDFQKTWASETIGNARLTSGHKQDLRGYRRSAFSVAPS
ncbi:hypothetical protein OOK29_26070 [Streptomyces phaeochromogenes]|uniref:hypothetical protein n=1 Tax=Streptomyces phaeochromogenes TaxID=1923 RepID=UPI002252AB7C|nr:hypothetical protein [Streptomyces phaeochromogenes]MCX5601622.1 hypothetical protein [Streptomyces phaeochromogenes]